MARPLSALVALLFACAALLSVASATMNCISYEPFSNRNYPGKIYDALYGDLDLIKKQGFPCIKTYYSSYYGLNAAEVAHNIGLKIVLGVRMEAGDLVNSEVEAAVLACNKYPDTVEAIYIGNENLPYANPQDIINIRNRIKQRCNKPIGTVQTISYWLNKGGVAWDVFWAMDWWGYNAYSFFGQIGGRNSIDVLRDQIGQMQRAYPDVFDRFHLTETGWPTEGGQSQGNVASWSNAKAYADGVADMLCNGEFKNGWMSYFIFNDPAYKKNVPEFERHFGVASPDSIPKWDISRLARCGSSDEKTIAQEAKKSTDPVIEHPQADEKSSKDSAVLSLSADEAKDAKKAGLRGGASQVNIFNACDFPVTADLLVPQFAGRREIAARTWTNTQINEGQEGWVWKLYVNNEFQRPIQWEFTYKGGKIWYDLSLIDSKGAQLEKYAMTITCDDPNCNPRPNCAWTRCPSAYNPDGSKACSKYQVYYPDDKCCYPGEPSYAAAGGSTITLTLC
eukprot:TRINITY_DN4004_c0_g2_i1.p1 TRINITY_DN4004_c0_g2~~TRINITY_DN4004_c0_g2_i1.p1  ORF type:complete len:507 (-),score=66.27 TRINITY_DN4004_c0_g2_i1:642-2162(-)